VSRIHAGNIAQDQDEMSQHMLRRALSRHWWILVTVGLLVSVAGITFASVRPQQYTSTTEILLKPLAGSPFSSGSQKSPQQASVGLETEANLVSSPDVTARARKALNIPIQASQVAASIVPNSQILKISYKGQSTTAAKQGARAYANAFLQSRKARARTLRAHKVDDLKKRETSLEKQVDAAAKKTSAASSTSGSTARLQSLTNQLADLEDDLSTARAMTTAPGTVVARASAPGILQRGLPYAIGGLAVIIGFALGLALMVLRAWTDDRIDPRHDLSVAGVPIWAAMRDATQAATDGLVLEGGETNAREAYRRLRAAVVANVQRPSVIAVTSHEPMPPVTEMGANLAIALHEAGYKSAILDTEVEHPRVGELFGLQRGPGLAEVIAGTTSVEEATAARYGISVLAAGSNPHAIVERYSGEAFRSTAAAVRSRTDYAIMTADLSTAIGATIAGVADTVVLTVVEHVTTHEEVAEVVERAHTQNIRIAGLATISSRAAKYPAGELAPSSVQYVRDPTGTAEVAPLDKPNADPASG
jgi:Mrp family chromosome partitioning ATPase